LAIIGVDKETGVVAHVPSDTFVIVNVAPVVLFKLTVVVAPVNVNGLTVVVVAPVKVKLTCNPAVPVMVTIEAAPEQTGPLFDKDGVVGEGETVTA
jgi:hypothetical protein